MVWRESALAGSSPTPALLAGVEPHGTTVAIYAAHRNPQSVLFRSGRVGLHTHPRLWRNATLPRADPPLPTFFLLTMMSLYLCADVYQMFFFAGDLLERLTPLLADEVTQFLYSLDAVQYFDRATEQ